MALQVQPLGALGIARVNEQERVRLTARPDSCSEQTSLKTNKAAVKPKHVNVNTQ